MTISLLLVMTVLVQALSSGAAWQSAFTGGPGIPAASFRGSSNSNPPLWTMRDASASYWFRVGDAVQVVESVPKAGTNLMGMRGVVVETWEKCDVDPTCCCAEQVDSGLAVRVEFTNNTGEGEGESSSFFHYFAEEELIKVKQEEKLAFDGMTCTAFKLDKLQAYQSQPRGIASFEPKQTSSDDEPEEYS